MACHSCLEALLFLSPAWNILLSARSLSVHQILSGTKSDHRQEQFLGASPMLLTVLPMSQRTWLYYTGLQLWHVGSLVPGEFQQESCRWLLCSSPAYSNPWIVLNFSWAKGRVVPSERVQHHSQWAEECLHGNLKFFTSLSALHSSIQVWSFSVCPAL